MLLRAAGPADAGLLAQVLAVAADWRGSPRPVQQVLADPHLAAYVDDWPRPDDHGVVVLEHDVPVGAAWWRHLPHGYGFVAPEVPELTVGVLAQHRGRGAGTALLVRLVRDARDAGLPGLSLSVEPDNPALRLYRRLGFVEVGGSGGARTLLLRL